MIYRQPIIFIIKLFLFIFWLGLSSVIYAQSSASNTTTSTLIEAFDYKSANQKLVEINNSIKSHNTSIEELQTSLNILSDQQLRAKKCITDNTAQLESANKTLEQITVPGVKLPALTTEQTYLSNKKNTLLGQLSECHLYLLRAKEVNAGLQDEIKQLSKNQLFYSNQDIFTNIKNLPQYLSNAASTYSIKSFSENMGFTYLYQHTPILSLLALFLLIAFSFSFKLRTAFLRKEGKSSISNQTKKTIVILLNRYLYSLAAVIASIFFVAIISVYQRQWFDLLSVFLILLAYLGFLFFIRLSFYAPLTGKSFITMPRPLGAALTRRLNLFALLIVATYIAYLFFKDKPDHGVLIDLARAILIILACSSLITIILTLTKVPLLIEKYNRQRLFIGSLLIATLILNIVIELLGYHTLAFYLASNIALTIALFLLGFQLQKVISLCFEHIEKPKSGWLITVRQKIGPSKNEQPIEIHWLRMLSHCLVWIVLLFCLVAIWSVVPNNLQFLLNSFVEGFKIDSFYFIPLHILVGILIFIFACLTVRWIKQHIISSSKLKKNNQRENRESLALIVGYIGFSIAFLLGALIAGVNFSGLVIIAGALSVGIGFGLQNIANNFISGIVLLLEQPIKIGDRIIVGESEGYVRKISIRSTHITTTQRTDIILPNSELISKPVTNYMLYDMDYQVMVKVGIAYGSDTNLAKATLLRIAHEHWAVINNKEGFEPQVYFMSFAESSLEFRLYCLIKDINLKTVVVSELNFAVEKAFREQSIKIASPQQEIIIKSWPKKGSDDIPE